MRTITTLALAAVLTMGAVMANAQAQGVPPKAQTPAARQHRHEMMQKMMDELGLTKAQRDQLKTLHEHTRTKMKAIFASNQAPDAKKAEAKKIREASHKEMLSILTPSQRQKLEAMRAQWKANHKGGARG